MRRREFIVVLGGAAAWPLAARAQQSGRIRVVGFLTGLSTDMPIANLEERAFLEGLQQLGWAPGRDVRMARVVVRSGAQYRLLAQLGPSAMSVLGPLIG